MTPVAFTVGTGDIGGGGTAAAPALRDFTAPAVWGRLTAEPRAGWYSWRGVAEKADGGWELLPDTPDFPYGTAAADAADDFWPARGANEETGLTTGEDDGLVVRLEYDPVKPGWRFVVGGAAASDWDTYRITGGGGCKYSGVRIARGDGCEWEDVGEEVTLFRTPSALPLEPDIDVDQTVLARPNGTDGERELTPWGGIQTTLVCDKTGGPPTYKVEFCVPSKFAVSCTSGGITFSVTHYKRHGLKISARDLRAAIVVVEGTDCTAAFPADSDCTTLPHPPYGP